MANKTGIQWVTNDDGNQGSTVNPIVGCSFASPECANCYAMSQAARMKRMHSSTYQEDVVKDDGNWTGKTKFVRERLSALLRSTRDETVFLGSMSDIFHHTVKDEWLDLIFGTMQLTRWKNYILLTKRADRMLEYIDNLNLLKCLDAVREYYPNVFDNSARTRDHFNRVREGVVLNRQEGHRDKVPNARLGVSCGLQSVVDKRLQPLTELTYMGWKTWISAEPLLEEVNLNLVRLDPRDWYRGPATPGRGYQVYQVVVGGESEQYQIVEGQPDTLKPARKFDLDWARSILKQCRNADTSFFMKQMGSNAWDGDVKLSYKSSHAGSIEEFPFDLQVREQPVILF